MTSGTWLAHHGIKGQKWGERNGPPYPLNPSEDYSKEEKKEAGISPKRSQSTATKSSKGLSKEDVSRFVKIGAVAAGTALAAYGTYKIAKNYNFVGNLDPVTGLPLLDEKRNVQDILNTLNPGLFNKNGLDLEIVPGSTTNCAMCTTAIDLQTRGFDVQPGQTKDGMTYSEIAELYKNTTKSDFDTIADVNGNSSTIEEHMKWLNSKNNVVADAEKKMLEIYPDGAHGNFIMQNGWGAHSVFFEISDGKVILSDGQHNHRGSMLDVLEYDGFATSDGGPSGYDLRLSTLRTDNREPDYKKMLDNGVIRTGTTTKFIVDNLPEVASAFWQPVKPYVFAGAVGSLYIAGLVAAAKKNAEKEKEQDGRES